MDTQFGTNVKSDVLFRGHFLGATSFQYSAGRCAECVPTVLQVDVMKEAYAQGVEAELDHECVGDQIKCKDVGHNIYILAHQVP